jgi:hypothetical protein
MIIGMNDGEDLGGRFLHFFCGHPEQSIQALLAYGMAMLPSLRRMSWKTNPDASDAVSWSRF